MAILFTSDAFVNTMKSIATNYNTLYVYCGFGAPLTQRNKERYSNNCAYNRRPERRAKIMAASNDTFAFDCVNLIKGVLWGWNGDLNKVYGGAVYGSNGVPDLNANDFFNSCCYDRTDRFDNLIPGELVWMPGHIGIYVGNGLAVECTPIWSDGVQLTAMGNIQPIAGYPTRTWSQHGKCEFIDYGSQPTPPTPPTPGFLPARGYYTMGDQDSHVELIDEFLASKTEGDYFGTYTKFAVMAFQHIKGLEEDGNIGPITLKYMKKDGLSSWIALPSRGYYRVGDSGNSIAQIDSFLANKIRGNYYGTYTNYAVRALQTIGRQDGVYTDVIDGNFGPMTLTTAEYYGFSY